MTIAVELMERGLAPDIVIRLGIRYMMRDRIRRQTGRGLEARSEAFRELIARLRSGPIAVLPENPGRHLYEFPPTTFRRLLGKRLKYSCCHWPAGVEDVDAAEEAMLDLTCRRAQVEDGMDILELGCGAGSMSFWLAEKYPNSSVVAISDRRRQIDFIEAQCKERNITNLRAVRADINEFDTEQRFDRIVSVEMFDHMCNYEKLMAATASWLKPDGKLFVHMVTHREYPMPVEKTDFEDWIAQYFFYGGLLASDSLLLHFQDHLALEDRWLVSGVHFQRTAAAWLNNLDSHKDEALSELRQVHDAQEAKRWINRWRAMLIMFEELFGYHNGEEWIVSHYLFRRRSPGH